MTNKTTSNRMVTTGNRMDAAILRECNFKECGLYIPIANTTNEIKNKTINNSAKTNYPLHTIFIKCVLIM